MKSELFFGFLLLIPIIAYLINNRNNAVPYAMSNNDINNTFKNLHEENTLFKSKIFIYLLIGIPFLCFIVYSASSPIEVSKTNEQIYISEKPIKTQIYKSQPQLNKKIHNPKIHHYNSDGVGVDKNGFEVDAEIEIK